VAKVQGGGEEGVNMKALLALPTMAA